MDVTKETKFIITVNIREAMFLKNLLDKVCTGERQLLDGFDEVEALTVLSDLASRLPV